MTTRYFFKGLDPDKGLQFMQAFFLVGIFNSL